MCVYVCRTVRFWKPIKCFFFFLIRKVLIVFVPISLCLKQNKFLKCFDRGLNYVQFVLDSSKKKKKSCIWKEKLSDATFVRLGRRNYVISVCALPFRAACNNDIVNDCLAWLSSSNMISIIMMCWCIKIIMKTNVNTCCTLGKVYTRSVLWPII